MTYPGSTAQSLDGEWPANLISARVSAVQLVQRSYEQSALTFDQYAKRVVDYADSAAEVARRALTYRRKQFLLDAWGPILKAKIGNWVTSDVLAMVLGQNKDNLDLSRNPAKRIWNELSVLYKLPPQRSTRAGDDSDKYATLVDGTGFESFWQLVELLLVTCNEVVVWPTVIEVDGVKRLVHKVAAGDTLTAVVLADEPSIVECWCIIDEYVDPMDGQKHRKYRLWSDNWHGEFAKGRDGLERTDRVELGGEDDPSEMNPYGEMPQVRARVNEWQDLTWDATTGEDLIDLTLQLAVNRMFRRYHQKMSGFKQLMATGNFDKDGRSILDPGYLVKLEGTDVTATQLDWQLDMKSPLECEAIEEAGAAASRGISPARYEQKTSYNTGIGALYAERGLAEHRIRFQPILAALEAAYYRKVILVCQAHGFEDLPDIDARLEVVHQQIAYPQDPRAQNELEKNEIAMGLESPLTILMRRNPSWTREEAQEALRQRMEEIAEWQRMKVTANVPNDPLKESASAEDNGRQGPIVRDGNKQEDQPGSQPGDTDSER